MPPFRDLTGLRFERLVVVKLSHMSDRAYWICCCDCGKTKTLAGSRLIKGNDRSCGCMRNELSSARAKVIMKGNKHRITHGMRNSVFYTAHRNMMSRCYDQNRDCYKHYGGRGIVVDAQWHVFENFYVDMYESFIGHVGRYGQRNTTLDRIDNDKGYSKENCRWATMKEQAANRRPPDNIKFNEGRVLR